MKNLFKTAIIVLTIISSFSFLSCNGIIGNGDVVTIEQDVSKFEKISLTCSAEVTIFYSDEFRVVVEAESNILPYVLTEVKDQKLVIKTKSNVYFSTNKGVKVLVYCKNINEISVSGSGDIFADEVHVSGDLKIIVTGSGTVNITDIYDCNNQVIKVSGSGDVKVGNVTSDYSNIIITGSGTCVVDEFVTNELETVISGSGDIKLAGDCNSAFLKISGSGTYSAYDLNTVNYDIVISGSGDARITCTDFLIAHISGSGNIYYYGSPRIDISGSGSGNVRSRN